MRRVLLFFFAVSFVLSVRVCAQNLVHKKTDAELMVRLYGNYDAHNEWSIWKPAHIPKKYEQYFEDGRGRTSMEFDQTVQVGSEQRRVVVLSTIADGGGFEGCHACSVLLSALVFSDGSPTPQIRQDFLMGYGQEGEAPDILLLRLGSARVGLEFTQDYCMGGDCEGSLFLFGEVDGELHQILALRSDNDDSNLNICTHPSKEDAADCKADPPYCFGKTDAADKDYRENCTSWTGSLAVVAPHQESGWSDLIFTQHVKAARPDTFTHRQYVTRFRFTGTMYKAYGPPSKGPSLDINYYSH